MIARYEVFSGKAKFGIFGDGKEVAQVALAHAFQKGDFRSEYCGELQITKADVTDILEGFRPRNSGKSGIEIYRASGWDYGQLCETFLAAAAVVRRNHTPAIVHVIELTQLQDHSTSS